MRGFPLIYKSLRSNIILAVGFNLQDRPSDAKGGGEAADQGQNEVMPAGPSRPASPEA